MTERDQEEQDWRIAMNIEDIVQKRLNEVKLSVEADKLVAEQDKLRRDRQLAPWVIAASIISALGAALIGGVAVAVISHMWR